MRMVYTPVGGVQISQHDKELICSYFSYFTPYIEGKNSSHLDFFLFLCISF